MSVRAVCGCGATPSRSTTAIGGFFALGSTHRFDARSGDLPDPRFIADLAVLATHGRRPDPTTRAQGQVVVGDPPGEAVSWQDRPYLLEATVHAAGTGRATVVSALAGQRGVGKTQLAAAYARLRIQHGWPVVVWANAETEDGIITALDELAATAGLPQAGADPQMAARAVLRWLRAHRGPCLLVYDNAVDADVVHAGTPTIGSVHTVVTTTNRELAGLGQLIDVTLFTGDEAVAYLHRRTGLDDPDGARLLAEELGRLPLALAQAGALLGTGRGLDWTLVHCSRRRQRPPRCAPPHPARGARTRPPGRHPGHHHHQQRRSSSGDR